MRTNRDRSTAGSGPRGGRATLYRVGMIALQQLAAALSLSGLAPSYDVTPERVSRLAADGFVQLPRVFSPAEIAAIRDDVVACAEELQCQCSACSRDAAADPLDARCRGCERHAETPAGLSKSFQKLSNLHRSCPAVRRVVMSKRLAAIARQLVGVDTIRLYQDRAFFKESGDVESSWHADGQASPLESDGDKQLVTIWISLDDIRAEHGPLAFSRGSHRLACPGSVRTEGLAARLTSMRRRSDAEIAAGECSIVEPGAMQAGDATAHMGWTLHRARANRGGSPRRALAVSFFPDGTRFPRDVMAFNSELGIKSGLADGGRFSVQLLSDDLNTWAPIMDAREMIPGALVSSSFTPLLN